MSTYIFQSANKNTYIYSSELKLYTLVHPLHYEFAILESQKEDATKILNSAKSDTISIQGNEFTIDEYKNQLRKYKYLQALIKDATNELEKVELIQITPEIIEFEIHNLSSVTFELTQRCNLSCKYCAYGEFYNDYPDRINKDMHFKTAKKVIDYLVDICNSNNHISHGRNLNIGFYGGEPTLNIKLLRRIVHYAKSKKLKSRQLVFSMTTNGLTLNNYLDFFVKNDFNIIISLDGNLSANSYRLLLNGESSFSRVIENIKEIRSKFPDYYKKHIYFNSVLHNKNSVEEIYKFFTEELNKIPLISQLNTNGIRRDRISDFMNIFKNSFESLHQCKPSV